MEDLFTYENDIELKAVEKRNRIIIASITIVVLAITILFTYALVKIITTPDYVYNRRTIPYSEMEYKRPDTDVIFAKIDDIIKVVKSNVSFDEKLTSIISIEPDYEHFYTMYVLADIKYKINITDTFYKAECEFFGEFTPVFEQKFEELYIACNDSGQADKFEKEYFGEGFFDAYKNGSVYNDSYVKLLQEESRLINIYVNTVTDATINYNGKEEFIDALMQRDMDEVEYDAVLALYYEKYNKILGDTFVDLVKTRLKIAKELGYDSYIDYAYEYYSRDYTAQQTTKFMQDVKQELVPLFEKLKKDDLYYNFDEFPGMDGKRVIYIMENASNNMSSEIEEIFNYMVEYGLYDITSSPNKVSMSFQTYLSAYDAPFIMINTYGDAYDLLVFAHEFGHFVDSYINYNNTVNNEDAEVASQSMEYLLLNYISRCSEEEKEYLKLMRFLKTLDLYIYQGSYNEFEERVYNLDEKDVTLENINKIAQESAEVFGLYDEDWEDYYALNWIDIEHFYVCPFYIISYCISNDAAIQIYENELVEKGSGVDYYINMIQRDWDITYIENVEKAGLESPFAEGRISKVSSMLENFFYLEDAA